MSAACLWCETQVKRSALACHVCGLQNPLYGLAEGARPSAQAARPNRNLFYAVMALPLLCVAALAVHLSGISLLPSFQDGAAARETASAATLSASSYSDPLERSVWADGMQAVRALLGQPGYNGFQQSYVNVAAGHVVTFCGMVAGTSGYQSASGERRFISIFGQVAGTLLEDGDMSFGVLWNRVCARAASPA